MKNYYLLFSFLFITFLSFAQAPFVTTWEVTDGSLDINIPISYDASTAIYNYSVDFGDGTVVNNNNYDTSHTYSQAGTYTVSITGVFQRIDFTNSIYNSSNKIKSVEQWGDIEWTSMKNAFRGCSNLVINAIEGPDLSQVTSLEYMFAGAINLNQSLNNWNVSNITNMENMFRDATLFNKPLNNWDVSNVESMAYMFYGATQFNQPLNNWNVSSVQDLNYMFSNFSTTSSFNQPLDNWDVSNVIDFTGMFRFATSFNQPLNNWDLSSAQDLSYMFSDATVFNQPLNNWNTNSVLDLSYMFSNAISFNQPIDNWDVSNVVGIDGMFRNSISFNQPLNSWDVSNVEGMVSTFYGATAFNQPLNNWNLNNVNLMYFMFRNAASFNQPLDNWDVSNIDDFYYMFAGATAFNQSLSSWDFSSATDLDSFVAYSGLDVLNYDSLLQNLTSLTININNFNPTGLEYCNLNARDYLINNLGWNISGDSISSDCNTIFGSFIYDQDSNGCDSADPLSNGFLINADNGNFNSSGIVVNGNYSISVFDNNFTVSILNLPNYFTASPQTATVDFLTSTTEQVDFCLTSNQTINDLNIRLLPISDARPGFEAEYKLIIENIGTQPLNNIMASLNFDDTKQSFISAIPAENSSSTNSLDFTIASLNPFETQEIDIVMQTFTPPTVNGDDILNFTATVLPDANDYTPNDNSFNLDQIVVNAFDPNDKRVLQGNTITTDETGNYLNYIIRFQNTGTANATFVRIEDNLDTDLDWNTFKITSASHNYEAKITNGNEVEFLFDNINLPYEAIDAEGSNGFIAYKIKPKTTVQVGDIMSGNASIYFDYNLPIITNTVSTEVISNLSVDEFNLDNLLSVYPNPTNGGVFIKHKDNVFLNSVKLYNVQGTELISINKDIDYLDIKNIAAGLYILSIETNKGKVNEKLVVK